MEGGEEQRRKGAGEADWRKSQQHQGSAGPWSSLQEPGLTQKQQQVLVKQWALYLVFLFEADDSGCVVAEPPTGPVSDTAATAGSVNMILNDWG